MLAAVLWLGNIAFTVIDNEDHVEINMSEGTAFVCVILIIVANSISFMLYALNMLNECRGIPVLFVLVFSSVCDILFFFFLIYCSLFQM